MVLLFVLIILIIYFIVKRKNIELGMMSRVLIFGGTCIVLFAILGYFVPPFYWLAIASGAITVFVFLAYLFKTLFKDQ